MDIASDICIQPATVDRFDDVATVLGPKRPDANVCWCLSHRVDSRTNKALVGPARAEFMRDLCAGPVAPGVLAYDSGDVAGWAAVAPRDELPVGRSRLIPRIDDLPVWSVICIRVRPGFRKRGIAHHLIQGAVEHARDGGAPVVEGYPVDNGGERVDLTMAFVGTLGLFESAGFEVVAPTRAVAGGFPRVLVRRDLRGT